VIKHGCSVDPGVSLLVYVPYSRQRTVENRQQAVDSRQEMRDRKKQTANLGVSLLVSVPV
jgi:hypothetical protein